MSVSIIVPVLNDAAALERCLESMRGWDCEIIVADGGSTDGAEAIAKKLGAKFVKTQPGRGTQMNVGTGLATGDWYWFLHADCTAEQEALAAIDALSKYTRWGCCKHRIDADGIGFRVIEFFDNLRARWMSLPYGDQGIFVRKKAFEDAGGYAEVPILEDVKLAQTLSKYGAPVVLKHKIRCDARRWQKYGLWRVTARNWKIIWQYLMKGKTPQELAALYQLS